MTHQEYEKAIDRLRKIAILANIKDKQYKAEAEKLIEEIKQYESKTEIRIMTSQEYIKALEKIPASGPEETERLSEIIEKYESKNYPIKPLTLEQILTSDCLDEEVCEIRKTAAKLLTKVRDDIEAKGLTVDTATEVMKFFETNDL